MAQPHASQFSGIFISYRRDDSAPDARHLRADLANHFGKHRVFRDINDIEAGEDFVEVIKRNVGSCEVLIAIIGRHWLSPVDGVRRLDNANDLVRLEIATAICRGIRVIPVLVQGATVPKPEDLPDELAKLAGRQAHKLSDDNWDYDVEKLIRAIERVLAEKPPPTAEASKVKPSTLHFVLGAIVLAVVLIIVYAYSNQVGSGPQTGNPPDPAKSPLTAPSPSWPTPSDSKNSRNQVNGNVRRLPTNQHSPKSGTKDGLTPDQEVIRALDRDERRRRAKREASDSGPSPIPTP